MSVDEFDPAIERLFARAPVMPDADLFAADIQARLASSSRLRTVALTAAGLVGGVIAVREVVGVDLPLGRSGAVADKAVNQTAETAFVSIQAAIQPVLEPLGLSQANLLGLGGMQLFWITAASLLALLATGVARLSQEA